MVFFSTFQLKKCRNKPTEWSREMKKFLAWGGSGSTGTRVALRLLCAKLYLLNQFSLPPVNHLCTPGALTHWIYYTQWEHRGRMMTLQLMVLAQPLDSSVNYTALPFAPVGIHVNCTDSEALQHLIPLWVTSSTIERGCMRPDTYAD